MSQSPAPNARDQHFPARRRRVGLVCVQWSIRHDDDVRGHPEQLDAIENDAGGPARGRLRVPVGMTLLGAVVLAGVGGAFVGRATGPEPTATPTTTAAPSIAQPSEVSTASLVLGRGVATAEWSFVVFDLTSRSLNVSLDDLSPPDADLAVAVRVSGGRSLNVGRTSDAVCDRGTVHAVCKFEATSLEGARPGTWVVRIEKNSQPDARVALTVRLEQ